MPIQKIPVLHKFGIISQTHQQEIKQRYAKSQQQQQRSKIVDDVSSSRTPDVDSIERLINQLNNETEEITLQNLEEKLLVFLHRAKHQLLTIQSKPSWDVYKQNWNDLTILANCSSRKITEAALQLLKESLSNAPLTKNLIECLLEISVNCLHTFIRDNEKIEILENLNLKLQVCSLVITRLYYHHIAKDLNTIHFSRLEVIYLMNLGVKKNLSYYDKNPFHWFLLNLIVSKVDVICHDVETYQQRLIDKETVGDGEEEKPVSHDGVKIVQFLWDSLLVWKSVSRSTHLEDEVLDSLKSTDLFNVKCDSSVWLDYDLSFRILCECAKLKLNHLKLFLHLSTHCNCIPSRIKNKSKQTSTNPTRGHTDIPPSTSSTPSIIHKMDQFLQDQSELSDHSKVKTCEVEDKPVSKEEIITQADKLISRVSINDTTSRSAYQSKTYKKENAIIKYWDWKLLMSYLICLRNICLHGLTIHIQKLALVGDENYHGLIDFLKSDQGENCWRIRGCTYVLLKQLYYAFLTDLTKDGLKNLIWSTLMEIEQMERDVKLLALINNQLRSELSEIKDGALYTKLATNLCILVLPADGMFECGVKTSKDNKYKKHKEINSSSRKPKKQSPEKKEIPPFVFKNKNISNTRYETDTWREMQEVAATYYHREVEEDELEREKLELEAKEEN